MVPDITQLTLAELGDAMRTRRISSVEATKACLAEVDRWQPVINCCINLDPAAALTRARAADQEIGSGNWRGPLHGVPIAFKDMFARSGKRVTFGSKIYANYVASRTATVIDRLEQAGSVLLGGLNMGEFAISPTGHNDHFGDCRNPWNPERITGGSSSGSGAATAARVVFAALGSDTGGSIRLPATLCGVTGIKPTYGVVSRHGCMPRSWSLDTVGPLARSALDCALVLEAIAGPDPSDASTLGPHLEKLVPNASADIRGIRIGVPYEDDFWSVSSEIASLLEDSLAVYTSLGATVSTIRLPDVRRYYHPANLINKVEGASAHRALIMKQVEHYAPSAISRLEPGLCIPATHYLDAQRARLPLLREFVDACFSQVDALLLPVVSTRTPTIEEARFHGSATQPRLVEQMTRFTRWVNYLGLPALSCPCGNDSESLPVGYQLLGRPFSDALLLRVADAFQRSTAWHTTRPVLAH